jgi:YD repeat-containing protein
MKLSALSFSAALLVAMALSAARADTSYTYDALGRISTVTYDDGKRVTYAYDAAGNRTSYVVDLVVAPQPGNRPPIAIADSASTSDAVAYAVTLDPRTNDSDPDGNALQVSVVTNGTRGTATILTGGTAVRYQLTGTPPAAGATLTDGVSDTGTDGNGGSASATVTITITTTPQGDPGGGGILN